MTLKDNKKKMFYFRLRDKSGMIKIKAFAKEAMTFEPIIKIGHFYALQYGKVSPVQHGNPFYPLNYEITLANSSLVLYQFLNV